MERHVLNRHRAGKQTARRGSGQCQPGRDLRGHGLRIRHPDAVRVGLHAELESAILPPPVSPVMFWITASVPLKLTTPFALEIPLGRSTILNDAFCNCRRPLINGFALLPVTEAFSRTPPEAKMSELSACNTSSFTLPSTRRLSAPGSTMDAVPVTARFVEGPAILAPRMVISPRSSAATMGPSLCSSKLTRGFFTAPVPTECASNFVSCKVPRRSRRSCGARAAAPATLTCPSSDPSNVCTVLWSHALSPE